MTDNRKKANVSPETLAMTDADIIRQAAERVMRWPVEEFGNVLVIRPPDSLQSYIWVEDHDPNRMATLWNPLTSISDAFMLVEKMRDRRGMFMVLESPSIAIITWMCRWFRAGAHVPVSIETAAEPGRAIVMASLAAIKAMEDTDGK